MLKQQRWKFPHRHHDIRHLVGHWWWIRARWTMPGVHWSFHCWSPRAPAASWVERSAPHVAWVARRTEGPAHSQRPREGEELATAESLRWRSSAEAGRECTDIAERYKVICTTCRYWVYKNASFNLDLIQNLQMMYGHDWNKLANGSCVQRRSLRKL